MDQKDRVFTPTFIANLFLIAGTVFLFLKGKINAYVGYDGAMHDGTALMLIGLAIFWIFPETLLGFFEASDMMLEIGVPALQTISLSFIFAGFSIITLSVCQALGHGFMGLVVSVVRQLVVLVPVAYLLSRTGVLSAIWWAFPIAEVVAVSLAAIFLRQVYRKEIKPLEETANSKPV